MGSCATDLQRVHPNLKAVRLCQTMSYLDIDSVFMPIQVWSLPCQEKKKVVKQGLISEPVMAPDTQLTQCVELDGCLLKVFIVEFFFDALGGLGA